MKQFCALLAGIALLLCSTVSASPFSPHPACSNPNFNPLQHSAKQLLAIGFSCDSPAAVRLFLNRARHVELLEQWGHLAFIDGTGESGRRIQALSLYVALIESFAQIDKVPSPAWMVRLNRGYQDANSIQDSVLRGFSTSTHN